MSDVTATLSSLGRASELPVSVVCVGVGDGPFGLMEDIDDIPTERRRFDNFQVKYIFYRNYACLITCK